MSELELKFAVSADQQKAIEAAVNALGPHRERLISWYFDTSDRQLASHHVALRLRKSGKHWQQTLKGPGASPIDRLEENVERPGRWGADGPDVDPALHADTAAGNRLAGALAASADPTLQRIYLSDFQRDSVLIEHQGSTIELAFDQGRLRADTAAGVRTRPILELEFELKSGQPSALLAVARQWASRHGLWLSTTSKAAHGDRLARGQEVAVAVTSSIPRVDRKVDARELSRAWISSCLDQVLGNASELAAGPVTAELIHQLRVGLRRLRSVWRELGKVAPTIEADWQTPVSRVFQQLGEMRDRDSAVAAVHQSLIDAGCPPFDLNEIDTAAAPHAGEPAGTGAAVTTALGDAGDLVRDPAFQSALLDLLAVTLRDTDPSAAPAPPAAATQRGAKVVRARLKALHRKLVKGAQDFDSADEITRHAIRKQLKRLRYLAELAAPLFDSRDTRRYLSQLKAAQNRIGEYHDLVVATDVYRQAVEQGVAPAWFALGWLSAQRPASARKCRNALRRAADTPVFW